MKKAIVLVLMIFLAEKVFSQISCFPENGHVYPVVTTQKNLNFNSIDETRFNELIELFETVWKPIIHLKYNKELIIKKQWQESKVNAHATRDDNNNPIIVINGGLARHPALNEAGLLLILCHELGHHYGGAPKSFRGRSERRSWSSAEGQADYFATNKCMKKIISKAGDIFIATKVISSSPRCASQYCQKLASAALSVGEMFASLKPYWERPNLNKRDTKIVVRTEYSHPIPQCRLDTFVAGAMCSSEYDVDFDNIDYKIGSCLKNENPEGARPQCWFAPQKY